MRLSPNYSSREYRRFAIDGLEESHQSLPRGWVRDEMLSYSTRVVLRAVQNILQCLGESAVEVRRGFVHAQQRRNVESVSAKRCNCGSGIRRVDANFILPAGRRKCTDIVKNVGSLGDGLPKFCADDPLIAKPEVDLGRRRRCVVQRRPRPLGPTVTTGTAHTRGDETDLSKQLPSRHGQRITGTDRSTTRTYSGDKDVDRVLTLVASRALHGQEVGYAGRAGNLKAAPCHRQVPAQDPLAAGCTGGAGNSSVVGYTELEDRRLVGSRSIDAAHDVDLVRAERASDSESRTRSRQRRVRRCDARPGLRHILLDSGEHISGRILTADCKHSRRDNAQDAGCAEISAQSKSRVEGNPGSGAERVCLKSLDRIGI